MSLAPIGPNTPPLYFIERDFGKNGTAFVETSRDSNSRKKIIQDIIDGQVENVIRVLEIFEDEGTCRDVTEDIARECREQLDLDWCGCPRHLVDFIDQYCGAGTHERINAERVF